MEIKFFAPPTEPNKKGFMPPFVMMTVGSDDRLVFSNHKGNPRVVHEERGQDALGKHMWTVSAINHYQSFMECDILGLGNFCDLYESQLDEPFKCWDYVDKMEEMYLEE